MPFLSVHVISWGPVHTSKCFAQVCQDPKLLTEPVSWRFHPYLSQWKLLCSLICLSGLQSCLVFCLSVCSVLMSLGALLRCLWNGAALDCFSDLILLYSLAAILLYNSDKWLLIILINLLHKVHNLESFMFTMRLFLFGVSLKQQTRWCGNCLYI